MKDWCSCIGLLVAYFLIFVFTYALKGSTSMKESSSWFWGLGLIVSGIALCYFASKLSTCCPPDKQQEIEQLLNLVKEECGGISPAVIDVLRAEGVQYIQNLDYIPYFSGRKILSILFSIALVLFGALVSPYVSQITFFEAFIFLITVFLASIPIIAALYLICACIDSFLSMPRDNAQYLCDLLAALQIQLLTGYKFPAHDATSADAEQAVLNPGEMEHSSESSSNKEIHTPALDVQCDMDALQETTAPTSFFAEQEDAENEQQS